MFPCFFADLSPRKPVIRKAAKARCKREGWPTYPRFWDMWGFSLRIPTHCPVHKVEKRRSRDEVLGVAVKPRIPIQKRPEAAERRSWNPHMFERHTRLSHRSGFGICGFSSRPTTVHRHLPLITPCRDPRPFGSASIERTMDTRRGIRVSCRGPRPDGGSESAH